MEAEGLGFARGLLLFLPIAFVGLIARWADVLTKGALQNLPSAAKGSGSYMLASPTVGVFAKPAGTVLMAWTGWIGAGLAARCGWFAYIAAAFGAVASTLAPTLVPLGFDHDLVTLRLGAIVALVYPIASLPLRRLLRSMP